MPMTIYDHTLVDVFDKVLIWTQNTVPHAITTVQKEKLLHSLLPLAFNPEEVREICMDKIYKFED